ncbi:MAG: glycosyltransferase family 4 protein [Thermodesulfovibrionales bacterium]|nr:glycosyltransferase family 4 protein [Thermodesulfovibrionales bacterium]
MKRKLKILFTHRFSFGGGLIITHYLCNHLVTLGHEVACIYIKNKLAHTKLPMFDNPQYKIVWLESLPMITFWTLNRFLKSYLKNNQIDAIISTGPEGGYLKNLCSKKSIIHIASYHHPNPTYADARVFLPNLKCFNPWNIGKWLHRWDLYFERLTLLKADVVHCLSEYQKTKASETLGIPEAKMVVIYCGVDIEKFSPSWDMKEPRILYCGGLVSNKGIGILLEALSGVIKKHNVSLDILGNGNWKPYKQKAIDLGIIDKVHYHGYVANDQIGEYYKEAYLFVAPTKHESFGLTLAEAMAAELPVVSTLTTAISEVVKDGVTGFLVPWNDVNALADAITKLLDSPEMAKSMGQAGRERVERMFTWDKAAQQMEELIIQTLKVKELIR